MTLFKKLAVVVIALGSVQIARADLGAVDEGGFSPSIFTFSKNEYTYQNGLGKTITGNSVLVKGIDLEWLPLNFTTNYSYNDITSLIESDHQFGEWRLATDVEVGLMLALYLNDTSIDLSDTSNNPRINGAFNSFYPYFGDTYSPLVLADPETAPWWWEYGFGYAAGLYDETNAPRPEYANALMFSDAHYNLEPTYLEGDRLHKFYVSMTEKEGTIGSYLVRVATPVPEPGTLLQQLVDAVVDVGAGKSLVRTVELAQTYYAVPDIQATCAVLTDFVSQLTSWSTGKRPKIGTEEAGTLIANAEAIMDAIGCD